MKNILVVMLCVLIVSACLPSQEEIQSTVQAAIAQTQAALPSSRFEPTATQKPTETPLPIATETLIPSPSRTPDVQVIDIDPRKLLLQKTDLPPEGKYFLPGAGWTSPLRNSEIVSVWTVEKGQAYLAETGRIDGWFVAYKRGASGVLMPEEVFDNVIICSSIEGAQLIVTKYDDRRIAEENYTEIDVPQIGDISRAFTKQETNTGGETRVWIYVSFSYRNVSHSINIYGWEKEINLDFAVNVAYILLEGLKQLPLSDHVTFTP